MRLTPGTKFAASAIIFDMDGTLIDSQHVIGRIWRRWAASRGLDAEPFVTSPGRRIAETLRLLGPADLDIAAEEAELTQAAANETEGLVAIAGAAAVLHSLPSNLWGIVTSAPRQVAETWLAHTGLPRPAVLVAAGDVPIGKPHPGAFIRAAELLGVAPKDMLVFEDATSGLTSAQAAGATVIAIAGTLAQEELDDYDWLSDFLRVSVEAAPAGLHLTVR
jgi:sugar-phosphatase